MNLLRRLARAYYNLCRQSGDAWRISERMHPRFWQKDYFLLSFTNRRIREAVGKYELKNVSILDLGCAQKPYKDLFSYQEYYGVDYFNTQSADDTRDLNVPQQFSHSYDVVVSFDTFEHIRNTDALLQTCNDNLKSGGILIISAPFFYSIHDSPYDYHRFTRHFYEQLLPESFSLLQLAESNYYPTSLLLGTNNILYRVPIPYILKYPLYTAINILGFVSEGLCGLLVRLLPWRPALALARSGPLEYFAVLRKK